MAVPEFTMRQLLEAGVHFGHQTHRWNPKMQSYIYGSRNGIHIIDLAQTVPLLHQALLAVTAAVAKGGRVLFVGTKRTAQEQIADSAKRSAQYYVNSRWLGGMLTNWKTISNSIKHLRTLDEQLAKEGMGLTKREMLSITREKTKLDKALGGIKDMGGTPDIMFVIDTNKEALAIKEANRLGIPVVAIIDTNSDPAGVNFPFRAMTMRAVPWRSIAISSRVPPLKASRRRKAPRAAMSAPMKTRWPKPYQRNNTIQGPAVSAGPYSIFERG